MSNLPLEWADRVLPVEGTLILERVNAYEGMIILPPRAKAGMKTAVSRVVRSGYGVDLAPGTYVMTAAGVNTHLVFGDREESRKLYFCSPSELMGILSGGLEAEDYGEAITGRRPQTGQAAAAIYDPAHDEGVVKAPRIDPWA